MLPGSGLKRRIRSPRHLGGGDRDARCQSVSASRSDPCSWAQTDPRERHPSLGALAPSIHHIPLSETGFDTLTQSVQPVIRREQQHNRGTNQATAEGTGDRDLQLHARDSPCSERSLGSAAAGRRPRARHVPEAVNLQLWSWGSGCRRSWGSASTATRGRAGPLRVPSSYGP